MRCLDLFAGVGGIRLGMERAGFETVYSNDFNKFSKITFDANHSEPKLTLADIKKVDETTLPEFDVLVGGFPCQAFSVFGTRKGFEDKTKGTLFFDMLRIMKHHRPRMALMENVKGLVGHDKGRTMETVLSSLEELGYHVHWKVLRSSEYADVPQMRDRIFIVSFLDKEEYDRFEFPEKIPPTRSVWDLIQWDEENEEGKEWLSGTLYEQVKERVPDMVRKQFYRWRSDEGFTLTKTPDVSPTLLTTLINSPLLIDGDNNQLRWLTARERFRIQGFPDDFVLPEDLNFMNFVFQAGNSVTVPLITRIGEKMMAATKGSEGKATQKSIKSGLLK